MRIEITPAVSKFYTEARIAIKPECDEDRKQLAFIRQMSEHSMDLQAAFAKEDLWLTAYCKLKEEVKA